MPLTVFPSINLTAIAESPNPQALTVTRATPALRTDRFGRLRAAVAGVLRHQYDRTSGEHKGWLIEGAATNLMTNSERFEVSPWAKNIGVYIIPAAAIAPDGTLTAIKLAETTAASMEHTLNWTQTVSNVTQTVSVYAKPAGRSLLALGFGNWAGASALAWFNLSTGTVSGQSTANADYGVPTTRIEAAGDGWYRCSVTVTKGSVNTTNTAIFLPASVSGSVSYTGDGTSGLYLWGAQLETGSSLATYVPSLPSFTSRASTASYFDSKGLLKYAAVNEARSQYLPSNLTLAPKLLAENAATNLLQYSEQLDNAYWTPTRATVSNTGVAAPDGTATGEKLVEDTTATSTHWTTRVVTITGGTNYACSVFAKKAERSRLVLTTNDGYTSLDAVFNLDTGVVDFASSTLTTILTPCSNGWYRCSVIRATNAAATFITVLFALDSGTSGGASTTYTGNGTSGLYLWGAQLEASALTSYVPNRPVFNGRSSVGSYLGSNGLVQYAAANVARNDHNPLDLTLPPLGLLEAAASNVIGYSEEFDNAAWLKNNAYLTSNVLLAPDGTLTATKLSENTTTSVEHYTEQYATTVAASTYTQSVWVKAGERSRLRFATYSRPTTSITAQVTFNLSDGTFSAPSVGGSATQSYSATQYPNGWWRIRQTATLPGTDTSRQFRVGLVGPDGSSTSYTGDGASGLYLWGAQLELGSSVTSYIPAFPSLTSRSSTATYLGADGYLKTAAANTARLAYTPTNLTLAPKPLFEHVATNLLTYSQRFDDATWTKTDASLTANVSVAPDGTVTGARLSAALSGGSNTCYLGKVTSVSASTIYTASVYLKAGTSPTTLLDFFTVSPYTEVTGLVTWGLVPTLTVGTASGGVSLGSTLLAVGNGWYRASLTLATATATQVALRVYVRSQGTANLSGEDVYVWGAQLEANPSGTSGPSSYIATTTASVTRAADTVSMAASTARAADTSTSGSVTRAADVTSSAATTKALDLVTVDALPTWYNPDQMTAVVQFTANTAGTTAIYSFNDGTQNNRILLRATDGALSFFVLVGGVTQAQLSLGTLTHGATYKVAAAWASNDFAASLNGATAVTDAAGSLPPITQLQLGLEMVSNPLNSTIKQFTGFPRRIDNATLKELSTL